MCSLQFSKVKTEAIQKKVKFNIVKETTIVKVEKKSNENELHFGGDISKGPGASYGGNEFWVLIVDNKKIEDNGTDMCWSEFTKKKNELVDIVEMFFDMLEKKKISETNRNQNKIGQCRRKCCIAKRIRAVQVECEI